MRKSYPSDISREQFEEIRKELVGAKKRTHPSKYDLYDLFCAVLYLLKEGCTWRAIPHDFPKWQNEYETENITETLFTLLSEYKQKGISISEIQTDRVSLEQNFMNIVRGAN